MRPWFVCVGETNWNARSSALAPAGTSTWNAYTLTGSRRHGKQLAAGANLDSRQQVDRAARRVLAGKPLGIQQRQRPRLRDRNALADAEDAARHVARIDVERDDARIRHVARLDDRRRKRHPTRLAPRTERDENRGCKSSRAPEGHTATPKRSASIPRAPGTDARTRGATARNGGGRTSNAPPETVCAQGCAQTSPRDGLPACLGRGIRGAAAARDDAEPDSSLRIRERAAPRSSRSRR